MGEFHERSDFFLPLVHRAATAAIAVALGVFWMGFATPAQALPSFARQTGQPCGACHTDFAGLTPYGRRFKIGGYTYGGGPVAGVSGGLRGGICGADAGDGAAGVFVLTGCGGGTERGWGILWGGRGG